MLQFRADVNAEDCLLISAVFTRALAKSFLLIVMMKIIGIDSRLKGKMNLNNSLPDGNAQFADTDRQVPENKIKMIKKF